MKKQNKGITLIALVITIIVLLILAGVALSIVFNGGIIDKSQNSVDKYGDASKYERDELSSIDQKIGDYFSKREEKKVLDNIFSNNWSVGKTDTGYIAADYDNDKLYTLDAQGNIVSEEELVYADEGLFTFDESTGTITGRNWSNWSLTVPKTFVIPKTINNIQVTGVSSYVISNFNDIDICIYPVGFTSIDGCGSAHTVAMPTSVTTLSFSGSYKLKNILIPSGVTSIGGSAFSGCTGLISVTIPDSVTSIQSYAFSGCTSLTNLTIPDSVTSIQGYAFSGCTSLTNLTIPNSVTSIGGNAFNGCKGLTSVTIPNSVTSIGSSAFSGCSGLVSIVVESGNTKYDSRDNCNAIIETAKKTLVAGCNNTIIPQNITEIGSGAFRGCTGITNITIPSSVTTIGSNAFSECTGLTSVTIPNGVKIIDGEAFNYCTGLTSITIPASVTNFSTNPWVDKFTGVQIFKGCTNLQSIVVEEGNTKFDSRDNCNGIIMTDTNKLLAACKNTTIPQTVTTIDSYVFSDYTELTSVTIPEGVTSIGEKAFKGCTGLTSVTIPSSVTSFGSGAFSECTGLISVTIPSGVTSIGGFNECTSLISVTIPSGVTSINGSSFYNCTGLTSVTIPSTVTSIGSRAFYGLAKKSTIYVETEAVKTLLNGKYTTSKTTVVVDPSKF